tara:strand:- start:185 stop:529 length:345 start_codon:yes stop_codon:yes gene_type:complete
MVDREELRAILHKEEMNEYKQIVAEKYEKNQREKMEREKLLAGPTEYIDLLRKAPRVNVTVTDVANEAFPYQSKIEQEYQSGLNKLEGHYYGIVHGMFIRIFLLSLFGLVYLYG